MLPHQTKRLENNIPSKRSQKTNWVFLDLVCEDFIEYFCIDIHKRNWSEVLFVGSFCGLGIRIIVAS
jgi:hypothetical protein